MDAVDCLKEKHQRLSSKMSVLESALGMGEEARLVIREVCFSVSKQLRQHITREERLVVACSRELGRVGSEELEWLAIEHHDARQRLQIVSWVLSGEPRFSLDVIRPTLTMVMATVRRQINEQETKLFPFLQLAFDLSGICRKDEWSAPVRLTETMTVYQMLQRYPDTKPVFEQFHIGMFEQYETLGEVAWCHGVNGRRLLARLEEMLKEPFKK